MINSNERIIKHKVGLLNLAEELGNVSQACKVMGLSYWINCGSPVFSVTVGGKAVKRFKGLSNIVIILHDNLKMAFKGCNQGYYSYGVQFQDITQHGYQYSVPEADW